jgi:hypothetical protein
LGNSLAAMEQSNPSESFLVIHRVMVREKKMNNRKVRLEKAQAKSSIKKRRSRKKKQESWLSESQYYSLKK